eukprot:3178571-Rhodomonas_salina.1
MKTPRDGDRPAAAFCSSNVMTYVPPGTVPFATGRTRTPFSRSHTAVDEKSSNAAEVGAERMDTSNALVLALSLPSRPVIETLPSRNRLARVLSVTVIVLTAS